MASIDDLPDENLSIIKSKLSLSDQARFRSICKRWDLLPSANPVLAMTYFWSDTIIFVSEVYKQRGERILTKVFTTEDGWPPYFYNGIDVCASKMGWLLVVDNEDPSRVAILCSPFAKRVLPLPRLGHLIKVAALSTSPTSPDCIIFVLYQALGQTHLGRCRIGDEGWSTLIVPEREAHPSAWSVVYLEGKLYCVFGDGVLGCYNVEEETWTILAESLPIPLYDFLFIHMVESKGKIFLATCSLGEKWHLLSFDVVEPQGTWIVETSLGMRTWLAGPTSFLVPADGDRMDLADCICYFDFPDCEPSCYSFKREELTDFDFRPQQQFRWVYNDQNLYVHNVGDDNEDTEDDEGEYEYGDVGEDDDEYVEEHDDEDEEEEYYDWKTWIEGSSI